MGKSLGWFFIYLFCFFKKFISSRKEDIGGVTIEWSHLVGLCWFAFYTSAVSYYINLV